MKTFPPLHTSFDARRWIKALIIVGLIFGLMLWYQHVFASDGTEFEEATRKFESWVKGNLGKLAAMVAIAVGSIMAAVRKDWSWFFGAIILAVGIGVVIGIVNASFTATV